MIPKVSIIIPVYNAEQYLSRCIESILSQTLRDVEVILVNDGSTDNSLLVCEKFKKIDNRIVIINKNNGGVSSARNAGLEIAKGEYIGFVDPDDWIESKMYEELYRQLKSLNAEIAFCNFCCEPQNNIISDLNIIKKDLLKGNEIIHYLVANMLGGPTLNSQAHTIMGSVWRILVKRGLILNNNIKFEVGLPLMEDLIFNIKLLLKSNKVCIIESIFYHYTLNINSNSAARSFRKDMAEIQHNVYEILERSLVEARLYNLVEQRMDIRYVNMCMAIIANECHKENTRTMKEKLENIKKVCKYNRLKHALKDVDTKEYTLRKKVMLKALKYELNWFLYIYYRYLMSSRICN